MLRRDPFADVEPLVRRVYAYVAYRIGEGADADDVTNETFAQALRYRDTFDPRRGEPVAWLIGIARREIARHFAGAGESVAELEDDDAASPRDENAETVARLDLADALATLSPRERELVALRYGADLTARQIAELLELRTNTVEVALHRALARLRELLSPDAEQKVESRAHDGAGAAAAAPTN